MKILLLSFFYYPDLSACSFRNTALADAIQHKLTSEDQIDVITTFPNRYQSYKTDTKLYESKGNVNIRRIVIAQHKNGFADQVLSFQQYFREVLKLVRKEKYDIVYASSSKLFTAFLGAVIARTKKIPLYLDLRDIFVDTLNDVIGNKILKLVLLPFLRVVESFTYKSAAHINLVSEGFREYFEKAYNGPITYYSNGIDDEFLTYVNDDTIKTGSPKVITYAGNIGEGQGLEKIIPDAAHKLGNEFLFRIIGDGGTKQKLVKRISELKLNNVELIPPVSRKELIKYYSDSDFLFLHLNNYKAFEKVLPSKIFEYGALSKPIIAGVSGYSRSFIEKNLPDSIVFDPGNVDEFYEKTLNARQTSIDRKEFVDKFSRSAIIDRLASSILDVAASYNTSLDYLILPHSTGNSST